MDEPSEEEITQWAEGLSPDGAPGLMAQRMRQYLGDKRYEQTMAHNDAAAVLYLSKQSLINNILSIVVYLGLVGLVGFVALVVKFIF